MTTGYYEQAIRDREIRDQAAGRTIDEDGWLHTGDIGEKDAEGRLFIRGRKKEMIVTPEGLNVFPDDVERALNAAAGRDRVGRRRYRATEGTESRDACTRCCVLEPGVDAETVVRDANAQLADHQRIRSFSIWTDGPLPRTEGTKKLKRAAIKQWVDQARTPAAAHAQRRSAAGAAGEVRRARVSSTARTSIEGLGLSSLERVELMVALEDQFQTRIDETKFAGAKTLDDLRAVIASAPQEAEVAEPVDFPSWNRAWPVRIIRRISQATWILPLGAHFRVGARQRARAPRAPRAGRSCSRPTIRATSTCR